MITKLEFEKCWIVLHFLGGVMISSGVYWLMSGVSHTPKHPWLTHHCVQCTLYTVHIHSKADVTKIFDF